MQTGDSLDGGNERESPDETTFHHSWNQPLGISPRFLAGTERERERVPADLGPRFP